MNVAGVLKPANPLVSMNGNAAPPACRCVPRGIEQVGDTRQHRGLARDRAQRVRIRRNVDDDADVSRILICRNSSIAAIVCTKPFTASFCAALYPETLSTAVSID